MDSISKKALEFAKTKHQGQKRKDGSPYINHPMKVANFVDYYFYDDIRLDELKAIAYLHDTLEDTNTTYEELVSNFGFFISSTVKELTNDDNKKKALTKKVYLSYKMCNMSDYALSIKLIDRLSNVEDLKNVDINFRIKYTKETIYILKYLLNNKELLHVQKEIIDEIIKVIKTERENTRVLKLAV